jgi:signal transduction histidine kinase
MRPQNCWEFKKCGRELGGQHVKEYGVCPASTFEDADGINRGKLAGRICWGVAGTLCGGRAQGIHAHDQPSCLQCDFYAHVREEEGQNFQPITAAMLESIKMVAVEHSIAGIAHCVKNMLNGIRGGLFIHEKNLRDAGMESPDRGLAQLQHNIERLKDLILDMLFVAKEQKPEYVWSDLNQLAGSVAALMTGKAQEQKVDLRFQPCDELSDVQVKLDDKGIYRCILNLVSNAIDACDRDNALVQISVSAPDPEQVVVEVSDQGSGMDQETQNYMFEMFFSRKGTKGTGLGLTVAHDIVKRHNGWISVNSTVGRGSIFSIHLPAKRRSAEPRNGDSTNRSTTRPST